MFEDFVNFTDEQTGIFIKQLYNYIQTGKVQFDDPILMGYWMGTKHNFDRLLDNYERKVETNRENGKKGGRPKKTQDNPTEPTITQQTQMVITETHDNPKNLKEKEKDIDKEKEKEKDKDKEKDKVISNRTSGEKFDEKFYNSNLHEIHHIMDTLNVSKIDAIELHRDFLNAMGNVFR